MRPLITISLLALTLSSCALARAYSTLSDLSISPQLVLLAGNSFDAVEITAKNVIVACTPVARPSACAGLNVPVLVSSIKAGRDARDGLEGFAAAHPGALGSAGLYDALLAATSTITKAVNTFNSGATP